MIRSRISSRTTEEGARHGRRPRSVFASRAPRRADEKKSNGRFPAETQTQPETEPESPLVPKPRLAARQRVRENCLGACLHHSPRRARRLVTSRAHDARPAQAQRCVFLEVAGGDAPTRVFSHAPRSPRSPARNVISRTHSIPCLLYTSPSPRDATLSRMPSSA